MDKKNSMKKYTEKGGPGMMDRIKGGLSGAAKSFYGPVDPASMASRAVRGAGEKMGSVRAPKMGKVPNGLKTLMKNSMKKAVNKFK